MSKQLHVPVTRAANAIKKKKKTLFMGLQPDSQYVMAKGNTNPS